MKTKTYTKKELNGEIFIFLDKEVDITSIRAHIHVIRRNMFKIIYLNTKAEIWHYVSDNIMLVKITLYDNNYVRRAIPDSMGMEYNINSDIHHKDFYL